MTPDEFRAVGHRLIDWIADYRATLAHRPVMARTAPGEIKSQLPASPPETPEDFERVFRDLERVILPGLSHWQHPALLRLLPRQRLARQRAGRLPEHGPGRARALLAIEPGPDGTGGGRHRLGPADGRPLRRLERRDPGHRLDQHAGGPALRPRAGHRLRHEPGRLAGRAAAPGRLRVEPGPQLGRARPRSWPDSAARTSEIVAHDAAYAMRPEALADGHRTGPRRRQEALRRRGDDRHDDLHRHRPGRGDRPAWRRTTASGCTSTPRWRARP